MSISGVSIDPPRVIAERNSFSSSTLVSSFISTFSLSLSLLSSFTSLLMSNSCFIRASIVDLSNPICLPFANNIA